MNLAAYVKNKEFDFESFKQDVKTAVRFLDNVLEVNQFALEDNREMSQRLRRLGLGVMGLADALIKMEQCYDTEQGRKSVMDMITALRDSAHEASKELAKERGLFPDFEKSNLEEKRRNVALLTVAPTGCVVPDTLISTSQGISPIVALGNSGGDKWQDLELNVYTDEGIKKAEKFFVNGYHPIKRLITKHGFSLAATNNHGLRVLDEFGNYIWRYMDDLQVGDQVILKRNTLDESPMIDLELVEIGASGISTVPEGMSPKLAEILGLYMGDGYLKERGGLHIVVNNQDLDLQDKVSQDLIQLFKNPKIHKEQRTGCSIINVNGRCISRFFQANNLAKPRGNHGEGAEGAFIPEAVLASGKEAVSCFLRGLFEADGCISRGIITLTSVSLTLIRQTQTALLALGIVAGIRQMPKSKGRFGKRPLFELCLLNNHEVDKFKQNIGFLSERKNDRLAAIEKNYAKADVINNQPLLDEFYMASQGIGHEDRQGLRTRVQSNKALSQDYVKQLIVKHPKLNETRLAQLIEKDVFIDEVADVEDSFSETYDLSVPENKTYIANGFISHNTTSMLMGVSSGVEPVFAPFIYRKVGSDYMPMIAPLFKELLELHKPQVDYELEGKWHWDKVVKAIQNNHGSVQNLDFVPKAVKDVFLCAHDVKPEDHVRMQGVVQRAFDDDGNKLANSISKTINMPNESTVEDVYSAYSLAFQESCKGITVYRDGSRDLQVLNTSTDTKSPDKPRSKKNASQEERLPSEPLFDRPMRLTGFTDTVKLTLPNGEKRGFYVTVNKQNDLPSEVFIISGKAGDEANADAEALGRLVSIALQYGVPAEAIVKTLRGINGGMYGSYQGRMVASKADLIAVALETAGLIGLNKNKAMSCPDCGNPLRFEEGCQKCGVCGYSKCG